MLTVTNQLMKVRTLIVDDNPNWRESLSMMVKAHPLLELIGTVESAMQAYANLMEEEIDLLICDIEMPDISGLSFARTIQNGPLVIFVTAHQHYAFDCYEVSPVDFLLKPIVYERFMQSIEKVKKRLVSAPEPISMAPYFFIQEGFNYVQISYNDVLYAKSQEHFLQIVTREKTYLPILSISKLEEQLKGDMFLRVHRSYLVHRSAIREIAKQELILTTGETIPIGDQYRAQFNRKHVDGHLISRRN